MKIRIFLLFGLFLRSYFLLAQTDTLYEQFEQDRITPAVLYNMAQEKVKTYKYYIGGSVSASWGQVTGVSLQPHFVYVPSRFLHIGAGAGYDYVAYDKKITGYPSEELHFFSTKLFLRSAVWRWVILQAQYEHYFYRWYDYKQNPATDKKQLQAPALFFGAGVMQNMTPDGRFGFELVLLWEVLQQDYSPYKDSVPLSTRFGLYYRF